MNNIKIGNNAFSSPQIVVGCMRFADMTQSEMNHYIHTAVENGATFFDHADIYGGGKSEEIFGLALEGDKSISREHILIQSKCGIRKGFYDQSKQYILDSVDESLRRLKTDYLDVLLIHRPDALVEPEEVAEAFDILLKNGKVRYFGVSNHKPSQIELLKKYVKQELIINQLQLSIPVSNMIANGMEVNMTTSGAADYDGSVLDYCRLHDITIQAWSPFQMPEWKGPFLGSELYPELNQAVNNMAAKYGVSSTTIAAAWILRHPAKMQVIAGSTKEQRLKEIIAACNVDLSRQEWYQLYLAAGHPLP